MRAAVKPTMEMMASLPSVVLGFIAALVLAPIVETLDRLVLLALLAMPLALLAARLPLAAPARSRLALRLDGLPKLALMFAALAVGRLAALRGGGRPSSARFFGGDFRAWLDGARPARAVPLPAPPPARLRRRRLCSSRAASARGLATRIRALDRDPRGARSTAPSGSDPRRRGRLLAGARRRSLLGALGLDPRGGVVDTYVQRNTLVVGFAMGFAVIPIIYTIAEDALNAVPSHLRAASLACGATPWQTAVSVIVPTAMSGIFAAIMIGMGRAVGETMIVVMAAGNTPILDWNVFNGLRALSANIAVELPGGREGRHALPHALPRGAHALRHDLRRQHGRRDRAPALPQARGASSEVGPWRPTLAGAITPAAAAPRRPRARTASPCASRWAARSRSASLLIVGFLLLVLWNGVDDVLAAARSSS